MKYKMIQVTVAVPGGVQERGGDEGREETESRWSTGEGALGSGWPAVRTVKYRVMTACYF